jgi:hypothetical protein
VLSGCRIRGNLTYENIYPGTSCLATITLSLRDKSHSPTMIPYAVAVRRGYEEAFTGWFQYLACQSGEQSSIGFQPVSHSHCRAMLSRNIPYLSAIQPWAGLSFVARNELVAAGFEHSNR